MMALCRNLVMVFVALVIGLVLAQPAIAQQKRIGLIGITSCEAGLPALAAKGWVIGQNLINDCILIGDKYDQIPALIAELVARNPDVLLATSSPFMREMRRATSTIPIVMFGIPDPVREGFITNLSRPGGNVTGFSHFGIELFGKRIQLLGEVAGPLKRVAILLRLGGDEGYRKALYEEADKVGKVRGFEWKPFDVEKGQDFKTVLAEIATQRFDAMYVVPSPLAVQHRKQMAELAIRYHLPAISDLEFFADDGLLMSYGPDRSRDFALSAEYVDRILRGEKAAELPVQQPAAFKLVVNAKTARELGLKVPENIRQLADTVVE